MRHCYQCGLQIEYPLEMDGEYFCGQACWEEADAERQRIEGELEASAARRIGILCGFELEDEDYETKRIRDVGREYANINHANDVEWEPED